MPRIEVELDRVATGGTGLGVGPDGRVVFATGGLPGERVVVEIEAEHSRRLEGRVAEVLRPSPGRRVAPCPRVAAGCGGCDWQHADEATQHDLRRAVVADCLRRLGRIEHPEIRSGPRLDPTGYRTTVRAAVAGGRAGFRAARSHDVVASGRCLVAHPGLAELLAEGRFGEAREVTLRIGARTGERLVLVAPTAAGVRVPDDVIVVGADEVAGGSDAHYHEEVGGRLLRISAGSFFQCRPDGAEALAALAADAIADAPGPLLDAYCGVGLFGVLAGQGRTVVGVESSRSSVPDAVHNYDRHLRGAKALRRTVESWRPAAPMGAVIADPARAGLGRRGAAAIVGSGAPVVVLISCDPASLARDAALLGDHGYRLERVTVVDLFAQTSHIETVSTFRRHRGPS